MAIQSGMRTEYPACFGMNAMFTVMTVLFLALPSAADSPVEADFVIRGATVYDGSGALGIKGDLALRGERIVAVGQFAVAGTPRVLDGTGLVVAPSFLDLHTHSDTQMIRPQTRANLRYLMQSVTTIVTGHCH